LPSISSSEPQPVPSSLISWSIFHSRQALLKRRPNCPVYLKQEAIS